MDVHLQQASPDANLSSNVQTTHNTSTITDSVVYIYIYTISYHTLNIVHHIVHISDTYLHNSYDKNGGFKSYQSSPQTNKPKKTPAICSAENPHLRIYVAGAPVGFFSPKSSQGMQPEVELKLYSRPKKFDK